MKTFELEQCIQWQKRAIAMITEDMPAGLQILLENVLEELEEDMAGRDNQRPQN